MKLRIKALVERTLDSGSGSSASSASSHPLLQGAAREFFERRERAFRPAVVLLVARALQEAGEEKLSARQTLLAEIVEMMCTAQIIHDSVLEDGADSDSGNVAHRMYVSASAGNKVSVLAGDFLLARCSVALSQLGDLAVVELMATALESMVHGGVLFAQAQPHELADLAHYERRARLKTSSLIADACRSAAILAGNEEAAAVSDAVHAYADSLGLAYQVVADTIAFQADLADHTDDLLATHSSSPPIIFAAETCAQLKDAVLKDASTHAGPALSLADVGRLVAEHGGVDKALSHGARHAHDAAGALSILPPSDYKDALLTLAEYVVQPDQRGLQRDKYIQAQQARAA